MQPKYEIWGADASEIAFIIFREDIATFDELPKALEDWRSGGREAFAIDKETREQVKI